MNQIYDLVNKKCIDCPKDTPIFNGSQCIACPSEKVYNSSSKKCEECEANKIVNEETKSCVCPQTTPFWNNV